MSLFLSERDVTTAGVTKSSELTAGKKSLRVYQRASTPNTALFNFQVNKICFITSLLRTNLKNDSVNYMIHYI
jgi:hypothetical protein